MASHWALTITRLPTEIRLLLLFIAIESVEDTFARAKSIPYSKGYFRKPPTRPGKPGATYGFEAFLLKMFADVGMRTGVKRIVQLRNEIIHSGLSRKPHSRQWAMYERIHDLVREYIIRLLRYHGGYLTYASQGNRAVKI